MDRVPRHRRDHAELDPNSLDAKQIGDGGAPDGRRRVRPNTVAALEDDLGTNINQAALAQAVAAARRIPIECSIEPSAEAFAARYAAGEPQVVWTTLVADLETPVSAFLKIAGTRAGGAAMSFLLESVEGGEVRGRYSIIGLEPDLIFRVNGAARRDQPHAAKRSRRLRADAAAAA